MVPGPLGPAPYKAFTKRFVTNTKDTLNKGHLSILFQSDANAFMYNLPLSKGHLRKFEWSQCVLYTEVPLY